MQRLILADTQAIFREGAARVLDVERDLSVVAQCADTPALQDAIDAHPKATVLFALDMVEDPSAMLQSLAEMGSRAVLILEFGMTLDDGLLKRVSGVVPRSIGGPELVECLRRVGAGARSILLPAASSRAAADRIGEKVLLRLTPRELQIVALVTEGGKNKDIAEQLGTKEQVIKNYLRTIYDKAGVSDRLELAVFTQHHPMLANAALKVRQEMLFGV